MMRALLLLSLATASLVAQASTITEDRVRAAVGWLAHDDRMGRDTGSPQLDEAAAWLAERFEKAGLSQVSKGTWYHEFALDGVRMDSDGVKLTLTRRVGSQSQPFELVAGRDVRQWLPSDGLEGEEACTVALADDPVLQRLLRAGSARRPIVIEVAEDHAFWRRAKGVHTKVTRRRMAARPMFLVRAGILPRAPADGREAEWTANWSVPKPERVEVAQRNVVALLPARAGGAHSDEYVVVSAHYDHIGVGPAVDGDSIYNGADDDATGTTAVLLLAEALAKERAALPRNVLFVCFAAEERGLRGSRAFCERPPVPLDKVVANLNIEMIGRPLKQNIGKAWVTGEGYSDFAEILREPLGRTGVELVPFDMAKMLFAASDNFSFVQKGVVAHSISAGSLHADYHRPSDEVDKLDIAHMTRIIRALYDATVELASREQAPQWNEAGNKVRERLRR